MLVVITALNLLTLTIPSELARYGVHGMPNNAIASAIVAFAGFINTVGMLVSISLTPMVLAGFLMRPSMRRIAWAVSAVLFLLRPLC